MFRERDGQSVNRCIYCERQTTLAYQRTPKGKRTKSAHYANNVENYRAIELRTKYAMIAIDGGASYLYGVAKRRAARYGLSFTISVTDVIVPDVCPVLNIPLHFSDTRTDNTPSLDRTDNTKGYEPGNVKVISWRANRLKQDLTINDVAKLHAYMERELTHGK